MTRKPSFANLRGHGTPATVTPPAAPTLETTPEPKRPASRHGRKQIAGFFTPEMSLAMHMLARRQGRSLQALMAEAFDDVLRKYGETPVGD